MSERYDDGRYSALQQARLTGTAGIISFVGTQGADAVLDRMQCLTNLRLLGASAYMFVGGTAAVNMKVVLQRSVAGTGTATTFASGLFNTQANLTKLNFTFASGTSNPTFNSGDVLILGILAGTSACTPVGSVDIIWRDQYVSGS
jgi:hypothetical protein